MKYINCLFWLLFSVAASAQFSQPEFVTNLTRPKEAYAVDLDGDSDLDILSQHDFGKIVWHENIDGQGQFSPEKRITSELVDIYAFDPVDLDQDGDIDLLVRENIGNRFFLYDNLDGKGNFSQRQPLFTTSQTLWFFDCADMDGDGHIDITALIDTSLLIYKGENGIFSGQADTVDLSGRTFYRDGRLADMDGDQDMDIVLMSNVGQEIYWFENSDGQGNFSAEQKIRDTIRSVFHIHMADVDLDGDLDVVHSEEGLDDQIILLRNDGNQLGFTPIELSEEVFLGIRAMALQDINNDQRPDLIFSSFTNNSSQNISQEEVRWLENGEQGWQASQVLYSGQKFSDIEHFVLADFSGDGQSDLLIGQSNPGSYQWGKAVGGSELFASPEEINHPIYGLIDFHVADIDKDGDLDLFSASELDDRIAWYENLDGKGQFGVQKTITRDTDGPIVVETADFDKDGDLDLLVASEIDSTIAWYPNLDGKGQFGSPNIVLADGRTLIRDAIPTDIDRDGDEDILLADGSKREIRWLENVDGKGRFEANASLVNYNHSGTIELKIADLNTDGLPDIVWRASVFERSISWLPNLNGQGSYGAMQSMAYRDFISAHSYDLVDVDNDSDIDVITTAGFGRSERLMLFENTDGQGNFQLKEIFTNGGTNRVIAADFDLDGDIDIQSGFSTWLENIGPGPTYVDRKLDYIFASGRLKMAADLNGDGYTDILSGSTGSFGNSIFWSENFMGRARLIACTYLDENENGQMDSLESGIKNQSLVISPEQLSLWSDQNGKHNYALSAGDYELSLIQDSCWSLTTDSVYNLTIDQQDTTYIAFGLKPKITKSKVTTNLSIPFARCNRVAPAWLEYTNEGTQKEDVLACLEIDTLLTFVTSNPLPDSIDGQFYYWKSNALPPTQSEVIRLDLVIPGVDAFSEKIEMGSRVYTQMNGLYTPTDSVDVSVRLLCAYDPNDKLVSPSRPALGNPTLFDETLEYTIRFQNTGNDTAFTVRLEDQLDADLDWTTFKPLAASHPYRAEINDGGLLIFTFDNIQLPDSNVNEVASHGFVKYTIEPFDGLAPGTLIENSAAIYFDFNPPILTNTVVSTLTDQLVRTREPVLSKNSLIRHFKIYPNPTTAAAFADIQLAAPSDYLLTLWSPIGQRLHQIGGQSQGEVFDQLQLEAYPPGMYFVLLQVGSERQSRKLLLVK
ncbi:MAG: FG-GAP-like repeat-containing protein [Bacteroidota bacterium]